MFSLNHYFGLTLNCHRVPRHLLHKTEPPLMNDNETISNSGKDKQYCRVMSSVELISTTSSSVDSSIGPIVFKVVVLSR